MTRAVILAAGFGSRLMPFTADRPKGMVALAGRPLLERQLEGLHEAGIRDVTIVGGYRSEALATLGVRLVTNPAYERTNMVESLMCARDLMDGTRDLVIAYGDIVYEPRVLGAALYGDGAFTVVADRRWRDLWNARMDEPESDAESFRVRPDGRLAELGRKPRGLDEVEGQYIGLMKVPADAQKALLAAYDGMDREAPVDGRAFGQMYMTSFIQFLIDNGWDVRPAWIDGGWLEVDTVEDLERYHALAAAGKLEAIFLLDVRDVKPVAAIAADGLSALDQPTAALVSKLVQGSVGAAEIKMLDRIARQIEIRGRLPIDAGAACSLLAGFLLAHVRTGDPRHLNTVLKALDGMRIEADPVAASALKRWCENAII